ncbi:MAG: carbon-nitrogen hydrolase family protein [Pseudomonadota bacterium]
MSHSEEKKSLMSVIQMTSSESISDNLKQAEALIVEAVSAGARLVALPETFALMPKHHSMRLEATETLGDGQMQNWMSRVSQENQCWIVGGTIASKSADGQRPFATCLIYDDQGLVRGQYQKIHLFDASLKQGESFRESSFTSPGNSPLVIDSPFGRLGVIVCYDVRFPELVRIMAQSGMDYLFIPSAFSVPTGIAHWELLLRARAVENQCYVIAPAQCGKHENGRTSYGHSMIIDPWGRVLASLENEQGVLTVDVDKSRIQEVSNQLPIDQHRRFNLDNMVLTSQNTINSSKENC